jgi:cytochrome c biogenesis protein CcmG/thiol:disulfide interchange protein DsbE
MVSSPCKSRVVADMLAGPTAFHGTAIIILRAPKLAFSAVSRIIVDSQTDPFALKRRLRHLKDAPVQGSSSFSIRNRVIPAITIVFVLGLLGLLAYTLFLEPRQSTVVGPGRVNSVGSLVLLGDRPAPSFTVTDFSGQQLSLDQFRGKTVVLNFWASWCGPCREEAPMLADLAKTSDPSKVAVVGIAVWDEEAESRAFLQEFGLTYPNGLDQAGSIAIDYGVSGVPETYFIGPNGTLLGKYPGALQSTQQLNDLLEEATGAG